MSKAWPKVRLGEVLRHRKEFITIDDLTSYKRPRVQLHVQGIVLRDEVPGALIKTKTQQVCRTGEFLVAEIDAKVGGFGIVPKSLDGSIVSSHYFLFVIDEAKLDRCFLDFFIRTPAFREQVAAQGSTNYAAIRPAHVLGYEIPLPPLAEQRRVVARIEELAAQIHEARTLRHQAAEEAEALVASETNARFTSDAVQRWPTRPLEEISEIRSGVTLGRRLTGKMVRLPYLRVANVQDGHLDLGQIKEIDVLESEADKWKLQRGDLLLTEGGDWDKLGRGTVWREEIPNCIHQNHIFRVRTRPDEFVPEFVSQLISSPVGKSYFQEASKQTTNLASINQRQLKAFRVFQPPLAEQRRIVAELDALQAEVDALKRLQAETAAELDALLPAILDRAFKGELLPGDTSATGDHLEFGIGGWIGTNHNLELRDGQLWYSAFEAGGSQPGRRERLDPSPAKWAAFWEAMERIGVWGWRSDYTTPHVLDGTSWSLNLQHAGRAISSGGDNGYPGGNGPRYSRTSAFAKLLGELRKLSGVDDIA